MKPLIKPLGSLLAILLSTGALLAQSTTDTPAVAGAVFSAGASNHHKRTVKTTVITINKFKDTYTTDVAAGGAVGVVGKLPSQDQSENSPKPKNPAKQEAIKNDQLFALGFEQYNILKQKNHFFESTHAEVIDAVINSFNAPDTDDSVILSEIFQAEEECQLDFLKKNLGVDQELTVENADQFLTTQEAGNFYALQAQLPKAPIYWAPKGNNNGFFYYDHSSSNSMDDLYSWYNKTNKYKQAALFFELEYLNFLVIDRQSQNLPADDRPSVDAFKSDLQNYDYSNFHSDDLLALELQMIDWENRILDSQNVGTETPGTSVTPSANDQPAVEQPSTGVSTGPVTTPGVDTTIPPNTPIISGDGPWYDEAGTEVSNLFSNSNPGTYHNRSGSTVTIPPANNEVANNQPGTENNVQPETPLASYKQPDYFNPGSVSGTDNNSTQSASVVEVPATDSNLTQKPKHSKAPKSGEANSGNSSPLVSQPSETGSNDNQPVIDKGNQQPLAPYFNPATPLPIGDSKGSTGLNPNFEKATDFPTIQL